MLTVLFSLLFVALEQDAGALAHCTYGQARLSRTCLLASLLLGSTVELRWCQKRSLKWLEEGCCCVAVGKYDQCGGAGGSCKGAQCKDAVWPGATCPSGFSCYRVSQWWRYAAVAILLCERLTDESHKARPYTSNHSTC